MNQLHLGIEEMGKMLFGRMKDAGLFLRLDLHEHNLRLPALPDGVEFHLKCANGHHRCEEHRLVCIPLVLVVNLMVPEIVDDEDCNNLQMWQASHSFEPYWLIDVSVIHDWIPYPDRPHRSLNVIESACLFAQHPYLGSVQSHDEPRHWGHGRIQVYRSIEAGCVIASRFGIPGYNHHVAFTTGTLGISAPFKSVKRVSKKRVEKPSEPHSPPATSEVVPVETPPVAEASPLFESPSPEQPMGFAGHIPPD